MQSAPLPLTQDLCLIGGGHTHALILRMWGMNPLPGARLTLINPAPVAPYTGMLPGFVAGHYARDQMMIDLVPLARFAGARLILDQVTGIDPVARQAHLAGRGPVGFDVASVNVGITSDLPGLPGFAEHGQAAKPLGGFAADWAAFVARGLAQPNVVVIGGGVAGVELAMAASHRLGTSARVTVVEQGSLILPLLGPKARAGLTAALAGFGIQVITGVRPVLLDAGAVHLSDGRVIASDFTLSAAGARAPGWLALSGLDVTDGFLNVGPTLQTSDPAIFAAGDCAHLTASPRPKAGVFAVREAPILLENLKVALAGRGQMRPYKPQRDYLKLISMGGQTALAEKSGLTLQGPRMWAWKDAIDTKFMRKLSDPPAMPLPTLPALAAKGLAQAVGTKPPCAGCGAKVGPGGLATALAGLAAPLRPDVLSGPGDDAAILRFGDGLQVITTDHLRTVTEDPGLMARIAAVHALGDIWAMGAAPQGALAQIILPRLSPDLQARTLAEIMSAAAAVFRAAGADIIGGHTSVGAELTIGFALTGLATRVTPKSAALPGDALILTKPLGTGTILAAEMSRTRLPGLLVGEALAAAHASMIRPMSADAALLAPHAHAITDVTGFGLAGHLLEILHVSNCAATLSLSALPLLPQAEALAAHGIASTLAPQNRLVAAAQMTPSDAPRTALLFDPQTCGGLLAAVPPDQARSLLQSLNDQGIPAALIGTLTPGIPRITLTD